ncbi:hypothetical protein EZS27_034549 [termite gut metagenome]|uniref:Uncharacterized protein n=1 Tax=termite gut metagenome TaxID=433724 RepID=A0A5J4Q2W2_9ZZZZ
MTERFGEFIDEINQLSPYKVSLKERGCYSFKTHNDKTYNIYFFQNEFFKRKEIVDLTIERMNDIIAPVDLKVRQTVVSIISILLNNLKDNFIIILSYDNIDGKSFKRYRVFDKWFSGQGIIYK